LRQVRFAGKKNNRRLIFEKHLQNVA